MKTRAGCDIEVQVCVVHAMQPPQGRYSMDHYVLEPDEEVHDQNRGQNGYPEWRYEIIKPSPTLFNGKEGRPDSCSRKQKSQYKAVEEDQAKIVGPANGFGRMQGPTRG